MTWGGFSTLPKGSSLFLNWVSAIYILDDTCLFSGPFPLLTVLLPPPRNRFFFFGFSVGETPPAGVVLLFCLRHPFFSSGFLVPLRPGNVSPWCLDYLCLFFTSDGNFFGLSPPNPKKGFFCIFFIVFPPDWFSVSFPSGFWFGLFSQDLLAHMVSSRNLPLSSRIPPQCPRHWEISRSHLWIFTHPKKPPSQVFLSCEIRFVLFDSFLPLPPLQKHPRFKFDLCAGHIPLNDAPRGDFANPKALSRFPNLFLACLFLPV